MELSEAEETTLWQLSTSHKHRDTHTRVTGLLMLWHRIKPKMIAEQLGVSGQGVYMWSNAWRGSGVGGHNGGRPRAFSDVKIATALDAARSEPLTLAQIAQRVRATHDKPLPCQIETFGEALRREDFSFKRNRYVLQEKRNEEHFQLKADTLGKLGCAAREGQCRLCYLNEAEFRAAPPVQRGWSPRGLPRSMEPNRHCKHSVVGTLDLDENSLSTSRVPRRKNVPTLSSFSTR